jgi:hypothetical protein
LPAVTGSFTVNIGRFNRKWQLFRVPVYEYVNR